MKKLIFIFVIIPFLLITAQSKFNFNVDYSRYKYNDSSSYVEFYYSFPQSQLAFVKKDNVFQVDGILHIEIKNKGTKEDFINKSWKIPNQFKDTSDVNMQKDLIGVVGFVIPSGNYSCKFVGSDLNNEKTKKEIAFPLVVKPFTRDSIVLSDVELASSIKKSDDNKSIFYKNTLEVLPHPINIFGESDPVIFYYQEIYNADKIDENAPLKIQTVILNSQGKPVFSRVKNLPGNQTAMVDVGTINVTKFSSGKYIFHLVLLNEANSLAGIQKEFFIFNPQVKDTIVASQGSGDVLSSQFAFISNEECDEYFKKSSYIASKDERDQFERIHTLDGKREYLYRFWNKIENDTTENDIHYNFTDYMNRVKIANEKYKNIGMAGWKTDRGRVYIQYGEPSEIDRHPSESNSRPYEIWKYNEIESGVEFVFGDITGFSNYILLSSTKRGELNDPNWKERITTMF
ncbi:MAG TPA: GWxTD domain-containing protein [Ignavibacteriaceae bacterium]|nr:GWxTD domain-containing protein [Ignavibacteriaceae bacterium]